MADRTGPRLQGDPVDRWPQQDFCLTFINDLTQFVRNPGIKLSDTPPHNHCLSQDVKDSFLNSINEYVNEYLTYHTHTWDKPVQFTMQRYMAQKEEDPWVPRALAQKSGQSPDLSTTGPESHGLDSRYLIQRAARDAAAIHWPETDMGLSVVETTRERSHSSYLQKTVGSYDRVIMQGGVAGLNRTGPSSRSGRSASVVKNADSKQRRSSSYEDCTFPKPEIKRPRNESPTNNKGLSVNQATPSRKHSVGSKCPSSRREAKQHKCLVCDEIFPFEARLKSHMAVHSKEKCRCNNCGSEFGRDSSLKRHLKTPNACDKKKEARLRQSSFQHSLGTDVAASVASRSSYRGSDCVSTDNPPHEPQYSRFQLSGGLTTMGGHPTRTHDQNHGYRNDNTLAVGSNYSQILYMEDQNPPPRDSFWNDINSPEVWDNRLEQFVTFGDE